MKLCSEGGGWSLRMGGQEWKIDSLNCISYHAHSQWQKHNRKQSKCLSQIHKKKKKLNYTIISLFLLSILQFVTSCLCPAASSWLKSKNTHRWLWNVTWLIYNKKIFTIALPRLCSFAPTCRKYTKLFSKFAPPIIFLKYYKNIQFSNNKTLKSHIFHLLNYSLHLSFLWGDTSAKHLSFITPTFFSSHTFIIVIIGIVLLPLLLLIIIIAFILSVRPPQTSKVSNPAFVLQLPDFVPRLHHWSARRFSYLLRMLRQRPSSFRISATSCRRAAFSLSR